MNKIKLYKAGKQGINMIKTPPGTPTMRSFAGMVTYQMKVNGYDPAIIDIGVTCLVPGERNVVYRSDKPDSTKTEPDPNSHFISTRSETIKATESLKKVIEKRVRELRKVLAIHNYKDENVKIRFNLERGNYNVEVSGWRYISRVLADFSEIKKPKRRPVMETGYPV